MDASVDEVLKLRAELESVTARFNDWKTKAKQGVEKQKAQLLKLVEENEVLAHRNAELEGEIANLESTVGVIDTSELDTRMEAERAALKLESQKRIDKLRASFNRELEAVEAEKQAAVAAALEQQRASVLQTLDKERRAGEGTLLSDYERLVKKLESNTNELERAFRDKASWYTASLEVAKEETIRTLQAHLNDVTVAHEKYRKKVDLTVKLATKDQDSLKGDVAELQEALSRKGGELSETKQAVHQRDLAIEALEGRVEELSTLVEQYEDRYQHTDNYEAQIAALRREMDSMEREFQLRSESVTELQSNEKISLIERYEAELAALAHDHEMELARVLNDCSRYEGGQRRGLKSNGDDAAYMDLVAENEKLKVSLRAQEDTINANALVIRDLKAKLARFDIPTPTARDGRASRHMDTSNADPQILRRHVYDLEEQLLSISDQLWKANQQVHDLKAELSSKKSTTEGGSHKDSDSNANGAQQTYMKAILLKLLCSQNTEVKSGLMPVLATLFKLSSEELRAVYCANPSWVK